MRFYITALLIFGFHFYSKAQFSPRDNVNISQENPVNDYALINDLQQIEIDKEKSKVSFYFVEDETSGTIEGLDFDINFNPEDPNNASFKGSALVETLDTDNFLRDGHLMWKKFFYEKQYPKITFVSKQVVDFDDNKFKVIGDLTIKGTTKEVILTFNVSDTELKGETSIYTSDYGVTIHDERAKNKLDIEFHFPRLN